MIDSMLSLWRYQKVTGYWRYARSVTPESKKKWFDIFQKDEPGEFFKVSKKRPVKKP